MAYLIDSKKLSLSATALLLAASALAADVKPAVQPSQNPPVLQPPPPVAPLPATTVQFQAQVGPSGFSAGANATTQQGNGGGVNFQMAPNGQINSVGGSVIIRFP
jgi:hypothetical protein